MQGNPVNQAVFEPLPGRAGPFLKGALENELKSAEITFEKAQRTVGSVNSVEM